MCLLKVMPVLNVPLDIPLTPVINANNVLTIKTVSSVNSITYQYVNNVLLDFIIKGGIALAVPLIIAKHAHKLFA